MELKLAIATGKCCSTITILLFLFALGTVRYASPWCPLKRRSECGTWDARCRSGSSQGFVLALIRARDKHVGRRITWSCNVTQADLDLHCRFHAGIVFGLFVITIYFLAGATVTDPYLAAWYTTTVTSGYGFSHANIDCSLSACSICNYQRESCRTCESDPSSWASVGA